MYVVPRKVSIQKVSVIGVRHLSLMHRGREFPLTQEFLSQMLGVHRPTVTIAATMLQKAGLIDYRRGEITVVDRKGLEAASCSCYRTIKDEYDRLLNGS